MPEDRLTRISIKNKKANHGINDENSQQDGNQAKTYWQYYILVFYKIVSYVSQCRTLK